MNSLAKELAERRVDELVGLIYNVIKDCIEGYSVEHGIECSTRDVEAIAGTKASLTGIVTRHLAALIDSALPKKPYEGEEVLQDVANKIVSATQDIWQEFPNIKQAKQALDCALVGLNEFASLNRAPAAPSTDQHDKAGALAEEK